MSGTCGTHSGRKKYFGGETRRKNLSGRLKVKYENNIKI